MERRNPTPEEVKKSFQSWIEHADNKPIEDVKKSAKVILDDFNLDLGDLKGKKVVDLGSGPSMVSRAAQAEGVDSVISMDKRSVALSKREDVKNKINADAQNMPFQDNSIDLIISHASGPSIRGGLATPEEQKEGALNMFNEMERVLSKNGEARIWPPDLFFIETAEYKKIQHIREKPYREVTAEEKEELKRHYIKTSEKSLEFLLSKGYDVKTEKIKQSRANNYWDYYWILKKRKEK